MRTLEEEQYQLKHHSWIIDYSALFADWETSLHKINTTKLFNGHCLLDVDPIVTHLCELLRTRQDYKSLQQHYDRFFDEREENPNLYDVKRILLMLCQHHIVRTSGFCDEPVALSHFSPTKLDNCIFIALEMLTFINGGEHWKITPYLILNPPAGCTHLLDQPEYNLARFVNYSFPRFEELKEFYFREVAASVCKKAVDDLINDLLLPMLNARLLVVIPKSDSYVDRLRRHRMVHARPSVFVSHPTIPHDGIAPVGFPNTIALIPTNRCNNRCLHCSAFQSDSDHYKDVLSLPVICRLFDEMHYNGLQSLRITGGEPMLRADFFDILEYAATKYFGLMLYTNGNLIDPSNIDRLAAVSDVKEGNFIIHLSIDGGRDGHDQFRRTPGAFNRVTNAMKLLQDHRIPYYIEMNCHPMMMRGSEFEDVVRMIHDLGSGQLLIHPTLQIGRGREHGELINMTFSQVKQMAERVQNVIEEYPGWYISFSSFELASASFTPINPSEETKDHEDNDEQNSTSINPRPTNGHCTGGKMQLCIAHDGNVYPCPSWVMMEGVSAMGNILQNSIAEIWCDSTKWKMHRGGWDYGDIFICRDCSYLSSCEIGRNCRVPAIEWFGTPYGPPPRCIAYFRELGIPEQAVRSFVKDISLSDRKANHNLKALLEEAQLTTSGNEASIVDSNDV
jgi:radical SAM protein with 4Fe4S-binding SPASM domain